MQAESGCYVTLTHVAARTFDEELPDDPEQRSLTYRLWGMAVDESAGRLLQAIELEADAKGCCLRR